MKPIEPKRTRGKSQRPVIKPQHISAFGILNRNGLEIPSGIETESVEREEDAKSKAFAEWSMPEQRPGFIQVKKHDFF